MLQTKPIYLISLLLLTGCSGVPDRKTASAGAPQAAKSEVKSENQPNPTGNNSGMESPESDANPALTAACEPTDVTFTGEDSSGGQTFNGNFPDPQKTFKEIAIAVCKTLYRDPAELKKNLNFKLWVHKYDGVAQAGGGQLEISSDYIASFAKNVGNDTDRIQLEFEGVLYHEICHLYQNAKNLPGYFVEGTCDYVRIVADKYEPGRKRKGGNYTDAYTTTGYFLKYLEEKQPRFMYKMNQAAKNWNDAFFQEQSGKSVDQLWTEYQATFSSAK